MSVPTKWQTMLGTSLVVVTLAAAGLLQRGMRALREDLGGSW